MEAKMPGEDYMGDVYEGYIPGALEELHNDGTAFIANVFHIDKVDGQNWTFLLTPYQDRSSLSDEQWSWIFNFNSTKFFFSTF